MSASQETSERLLSLEEFERLPEEDEFIVELVRGASFANRGRTE